MNSLRLDPLKMLVEGVLSERYSLQEEVFNYYIFSFPINLMLELQILVNHYLFSYTTVSMKLFFNTMGKREVAPGDFLISIQITLGIMPHTFYKKIPTSFYSLEKTAHHNIKTEKFQSS